MMKTKIKEEVPRRRRTVMMKTKIKEEVPRRRRSAAKQPNLSTHFFYEETIGIRSSPLFWMRLICGQKVGKKAVDPAMEIGMLYFVFYLWYLFNFNLFMCISVSFQYVCKYDSRYPECQAQIAFVEGTAMDADTGERITGWTARVPNGSELPNKDALPSSQGTTSNPLTIVTLPFFPAHNHNASKEQFTRGLPIGVIKIATAIFSECGGQITARKLRLQVRCTHANTSDDCLCTGT